jgi:hypothetical protein
MSFPPLRTSRSEADGRSPSQPLPGLAALLMSLLLPLTTVCRSVAVPPGDENPGARGTVSGTVRGPGGVDPAAGREVEATEVDTGRTYTAATNVAGSYTLMLPVGRYRLELKIEPGESLARQPGVVTVEAGELAADRDFVLAGAGVVKED